MKNRTELVGTKLWVKFPKINKNDSLDQNDTEISEGYNEEKCVVKKHIVLDWDEWVDITHSLLTDRDEWEKIGGSVSEDKRLEGCSSVDIMKDEKLYKIFRGTSFTEVVRVDICNKTWREQEVTGEPIDMHLQAPFFVNTEGHSYARYVGRLSGNLKPCK